MSAPDITSGAVSDRTTDVARIVFFACALVTVLTTFGIIAVLVTGAIPFFREVSLIEFFTGTTWSPLSEPRVYGIWPLIWGRC